MLQDSAISLWIGEANVQKCAFIAQARWAAKRHKLPNQQQCTAKVAYVWQTSTSSRKVPGGIFEDLESLSSILDRQSSLLPNLHIGSKDFLLGMRFPDHVACGAIDFRQGVQRNQRCLLHQNAAYLLK